ncbi:IS4 family transposase [Lapidilactobacillus concavus]|uniref:IS4 family transposase n=1 Tax=Lapidilactobacillus concavus TaxID=287844 RepID=UPI003B84AB01
MSQFCQLVHLPNLVHRLNDCRHSDVSLGPVLVWVLKTIFQRQTLYRAEAPTFCTKRTIYNMLDDGRINWQRLSCQLAQRVIASLTKRLDARHSGALIVDDTLIPRLSAKQTELLANTFDHDKSRHLTGFRGLTIAWSNGQLVLPVTTAVLSSKKASNRVRAPASTLDWRTLSGQRRAQAMQEMPTVSLALIKQALANGIKAKYVLFDSWFTSSKLLLALKRLGLVGVGMLKRTKKSYFRYWSREYTIPDLYRHLRRSNRQTHTHYLYSCIVKAERSGVELPIKLVFVTKAHRGNDYLVLATTDTTLTPTKIIGLYTRRWQIENYFRAAKQYLRLATVRFQDYDGLCAHMAITMMAYDLLAWQQRHQPNDQTLGDIFHNLNTLLPVLDLTLAVTQLLDGLSDMVQAEPKISTRVTTLINNLFNQLTPQVGTIIGAELTDIGI